MKPPKIVKIVFPTDGNMNMMPIVYNRIMFKWGNNVVDELDDAANYIRADIVDEMLASLEELLGGAPTENVTVNNVYARARAAVAKAKGETS